MSNKPEIIYEPHPVSPERKKDLRSKGLKIVDARFNPNPKPQKAEASSGSSSGGAAGTKADLQAQLKELGLEFPSNANKAELQALLDGAQQSQANDPEDEDDEE